MLHVFIESMDNISLFAKEREKGFCIGFPFSHPNFFPMGMGKIGNWEIFPWEFLGIFQNRKNAKKRTFLIALLFLLFFFQSLFPFKVTS